jgi:hypothetical protein
MQLTDRRQLQRHAKEDPCEQPEYVRAALLPGVAQTEYELQVNDELKEDEIYVGHVISMDIKDQAASIPGHT